MILFLSNILLYQRQLLVSFRPDTPFQISLFSCLQVTVIYTFLLLPKVSPLLLQINISQLKFPKFLFNPIFYCFLSNNANTLFYLSLSRSSVSFIHHKVKHCSKNHRCSPAFYRKKYCYACTDYCYHTHLPHLSFSICKIKFNLIIKVKKYTLMAYYKAY